MRKFLNDAYEPLVSELINDAFYLESRSRRGTISTVRQYSEIVVRKILDLPDSERVTLGDHKIVKKLEEVSAQNKLLLESIEYIREIGNKCTHTQYLSEITEDDVKTAIDKLFNLYSYLFINYFEKYKFGSNNQIKRKFSILPPVIRYITLEYLFQNDRTNLSLIDKLSLVILKVFDRNTAIEWVEENKSELSGLQTYTDQAIADIREKHGDAVAQNIINNAPENMYILCVERISDVASILEHQGKLYVNFEQALPLFLEEGKADGDTEEINEFNSIMDFVYLGRKASNDEVLKKRHLYTVVKN